MARQYGYATQVLLKKETTPGTAATGNFIKVPFNSCGIGSKQDIENDPLAGQGRDPLEGFPGPINVGGPMSVPLDVRYIGHYLSMLLGAPVTTGSGDPYTHTYKSGGLTLPAYSIEPGYSQVPIFNLTAGQYLNSMTFRPGRSGPAAVELNFLGMSEDPDSSSQGGTPTTHTLTRFSNFKGVLKQGGNVIANLNSADITYSNNLIPIETTNAAGLLEGIDPGQASCTGSLNLRFASNALLANALSGTPVDFDLVYEISASRKLTITVHQARLAKDVPNIEGPGGVNVNIPFIAEYNASNTAMFKAVLINDLAGATYQ